MNVIFSGDPTRKRIGDTVIRRGKIFKIGDYPDKGLSISFEDMQRAIANFKPVPIDIEHRPSLFDNKLGELFHIEFAENKEDVMGEWAMPSWLDQVVGDADITVSTQWDIPTKFITKLGTSVDPRVPDAAMKAGYTAFTNSKKEKTTMSKIWDWLNGKSEAERDALTIEQITAQFSDGEKPPADPKKETPAVVTTLETTPTIPAPDAALVAEFASMREQMAKMANDKRVDEATTFVSKMIRDARILPSQQGEWIARLSRDMKDDEEKRGTVTFSKADNTTEDISSAELTRKIMQGLQRHSLFTDHSLAAIPEGSALLSTTAGSKSAYEQGMEQGKAWAAKNTPVDAS